MRRHLPVQLADSVLLLCMLVPFGANLRAQSNEVLGEIELVGATKIEKTSGVWVDGQYLGYLKELKGSKKILLLPGQHEIVVRQDGYQDFTSKITVRPGEKQTISVKMVRDPRFQMPSVFCEIKLSVTPDRAAHFVYEHAATSNCRLRQSVVCAALPNVVLPGWAFPRFERLSAPALAAAL